MEMSNIHDINNNLRNQINEDILKIKTIHDLDKSLKNLIKLNENFAAYLVEMAINELKNS